MTPDKNGDWDNYDYEQLYLGKEGTLEVKGVDGSMSFPAAFAFETRGIDISSSTTFTDKLNPKNTDTYDPILANEYIQFIKNKSVEKAKRNNPNKVIKEASNKEDKDKSKLSQEDINLLTAPSTEIESFGGVQVKADPNFIDDVVGNKLTVGLKPEYLIEGQGELQSTFEALYKEQVKDSNKPITGNVTRVGLTTGNVPVAAVSFGTVEVIVPISRLSSVSEKLKDNAKAYKIYQLGSAQGSSSQGVGSKYNKQ